LIHHKVACISPCSKLFFIIVQAQFNHARFITSVKSQQTSSNNQDPLANLHKWNGSLQINVNFNVTIWPQLIMLHSNHHVHIVNATQKFLFNSVARVGGHEVRSCWQLNAA